MCCKIWCENFFKQTRPYSTEIPYIDSVHTFVQIKTSRMARARTCTWNDGKHHESRTPASQKDPRTPPCPWYMWRCHVPPLPVFTTGCVVVRTNAPRRLACDLTCSSAPLLPCWRHKLGWLSFSCARTKGFASHGPISAGPAFWPCLAHRSQSTCVEERGLLQKWVRRHHPPQPRTRLRSGIPKERYIQNDGTVLYFVWRTTEFRKSFAW